MINEKRVLDKFLEYVQIDSPTKFEKDFALHLTKELEELGLEVTMDDAGEKVGSNSGNLIAKLKGNTEGQPLIFSAHMDTVSPSRGIKPLIKDGVVYSDGTTILSSDDKAGVVAIMEALRVIREKDLPHGDIEVVFSIFEEGGLFGAKNLDISQLKGKNVYVLDSGGSPGEIVIQGPAQNKIDIEFIGKEAHAGVAPEEGISAIQIAARAIDKMKLLRIDEETTANIGSINGGEATNIVTSSVKVAAEARSLDNEKLKLQTDHMVKACEEAAAEFGGEVKIDVENAYEAFKVDSQEEIIKKVEEACENLDFKSFLTKSGGGSDTNIFNGKGLKAVNLGVGMKACHTLNEYIAIKDLEDSARLVLEIIKVYSK